MLVRSLSVCKKIIAGDGTELRELLHPDRQDIESRFSLAHAGLPPGTTSLLHVLKSSEVYYILKGRGRMEIDGEEKTVVPGDAVYIPPGGKQCIKSLGPENLEFLSLVDPAWKAEDEGVF